MYRQFVHTAPIDNGWVVEYEDSLIESHSLEFEYGWFEIQKRMPHCDRGKWELIFDCWGLAYEVIRNMVVPGGIYFIDIEKAKTEVKQWINLVRHLSSIYPETLNFKRFKFSLYAWFESESIQIKLFENTNETSFWVTEAIAKNKLADLDEQDGFPKTYLSLHVAEAEIKDWFAHRHLYARTQYVDLQVNI